MCRARGVGYWDGVKKQTGWRVGLGWFWFHFSFFFVALVYDDTGSHMYCTVGASRVSTGGGKIIPVLQ